MNRAAAGNILDWLGRGCGPAPVLAVVVAHPDDETIGGGARLPRLGDALFVCVTDGAPRDTTDAAAAGFPTREQYAAARRQEFSAVLAAAGIHPRVSHLEFVDQEASLNLSLLARTLAELFRVAQPEAILTHSYEGGHPDHDATALAVHTACRLLERSGSPLPLILEMASYNGSYGVMETESFLPAGGCEEVTLVLSEEERRFKARLFERYRTQQHVLRGFPMRVERFRVAPEYDFTKPPHPGRLFYENFAWGMNGARWRELARACREELEAACV
jgi:LmbE family N-acetylglucosaminyl deacetylase